MCIRDRHGDRAGAAGRAGLSQRAPRMAGDHCDEHACTRRAREQRAAPLRRIKINRRCKDARHAMRRNLFRHAPTRFLPPSRLNIGGLAGRLLEIAGGKSSPQGVPPAPLPIHFFCVRPDTVLPARVRPGSATPRWRPTFAVASGERTIQSIAANAHIPEYMVKN